MGIEIYHRKPIFYSLGNLIMQNDTLRHVPVAHLSEAYGTRVQLHDGHGIIRGT